VNSLVEAAFKLGEDADETGDGTVDCTTVRL